MKSTIEVKGRYNDLLLGPSCEVLFSSGWQPNRIVHRCHILLAAFMANIKKQTVVGIDHLVVGEGKEEWDDMEQTPKPEENEKGLINPCKDPIYRSQLKIYYDSDIEEKLTRKIIIKTVLHAGYPKPENGEIYPLREFGLFGKIKVQGISGEEPYMINCVRHRVIPKHISTSLVRTIELIL
ncbi:MAG: hypothetical protein ACFFCW_34805 [Candidatus Hodarchaeota archaeon]